MKYFILFKKKSLKVCHSTIYIFFFFISWEGNFILRVSLEADYHMFFCLSLSLSVFFFLLRRSVSRRGRLRVLSTWKKEARAIHQGATEGTRARVRRQ